MPKPDQTSCMPTKFSIVLGPVAYMPQHMPRPDQTSCMPTKFSIVLGPVAYLHTTYA